jgi:glutamine synthetase
MAEREAKGIHALPSSFGEALHALRQDEVLLEALGAARAKAYLAVKEMEWEALKDIPLEREVELLLERY